MFYTSLEKKEEIYRKRTARTEQAHGLYGKEETDAWGYDEHVQSFCCMSLDGTLDTSLYIMTEREVKVVEIQQLSDIGKIYELRPIGKELINQLSCQRDKV